MHMDGSYGRAIGHLQWKKVSNDGKKAKAITSFF